MNTEIKVGDIIKSFDFAHTDEDYKIGRVIRLEEHFGLIHCEMIKWVSGGRDVETSNLTFQTVELGLLQLDTIRLTPRLVVLG